MEYTLFSTGIDGTPCPECKFISFEINSKQLLRYFEGKKLICPKCNANLDWWKLLIRHFDWEFPSYLYAIVGGYQTNFMIEMKPNEIFKLVLEDVGISKDAKILQLGYTPNGDGLFPLEMHGNTPFRHFIPNTIYLYGRQIGELVDKTRVAVSVNWVPLLENNDLWDNLVEAVEAFRIRKYIATIIPANVAVEAKLSQILNDYLSTYASNERVKNFLNDGATYSHQLNVLLPMIAKYEKFPTLPEHICGALNSLRDRRNDIAHRGKPKKSLDKKLTGELLCSASFGLGYLYLLEEQIKKNYR